MMQQKIQAGELHGEMRIERTISVLAKVLGEEKAKSLSEECLREAGLLDATTPQEFLRYGQSLTRRGGFIEVVGRSVMARALIAGARLEA
ncbi:MAG TPA: hypothetical protein VJH03_03980 [Blastocatellia bacterium]|nr:hypothetical protein [Blastocatellia bacterium]